MFAVTSYSGVTYRGEQQSHWVSNNDLVNELKDRVVLLTEPQVYIQIHVNDNRMFKTL